MIEVADEDFTTTTINVPNDLQEKWIIREMENIKQ